MYHIEADGKALRPVFLSGTGKQIVLWYGVRMNTEKKSIGVAMSEAMDLAGLVGYQDGAVVSKTIITKKVGTVTIFAFAEGQGLSTHSAPYDALVYILDGESEVTISEQVMKVKAGEIVIMPANEPHGLEAKVPFKMMLVMIKA